MNFVLPKYETIIDFLLQIYLREIECALFGAPQGTNSLTEEAVFYRFAVSKAVHSKSSSLRRGDSLFSLVEKYSETRSGPNTHYSDKA